MKRRMKTKIAALIMAIVMIMPFMPVTAAGSAVGTTDEVATATDAKKEKKKEKEPEAELYNADTIYIENRGSVSYGDTYNNQFYISSISKWAFCGDANLECPGSGYYEYTLNQSAGWLDEVRSILLYADTIELSAKNYLGVMRAINNARHNGGNTLGSEYQSLAASFVAENYPGGVMSISEAALSFKYGSGDEIYHGKTITADIYGGGEVSGRVVTDTITLTGSAKNSIDVNLPSGVWMKYNNTWYKSGSVSISGNASIRFSLAAGDTKTYTLNNLKGKFGCDVYEINTGSSTQTLYYGITDYSQISFTLKAKEEKPVLHEITLIKKLKDTKCNLSVEGAEYTVYYVKDTGSTGKKYPVAMFTMDADGTGRVTDVYSVDCNTSGYEASFTAKGKNKTVLSGLPTGIYRIDETKAPAGMEKGSSFYVDFTGNKKNVERNDYSVLYTGKGNGEYSAACISFEKPLKDPVNITLQKYDVNTGKASAIGNASLEDAFFEVKFYPGNTDSGKVDLSSERPMETWIIKTKCNSKGEIIAKLSRDYVIKHVGDAVTDNDGDYALTEGTITIEETKAPSGYDTAKNGGKIITSGGTITGTDKIVLQNYYDAKLGRMALHSGEAAQTGKIEVFNILQEEAIKIYEPEKRYDIKFKKTDENGKPMPGVVFEVKSGSGESHVVVTDENGEFDSSVRKGAAFNENDALYKSYLETGEIPEYQYTDLYFYGNMEDNSKADLTLGSCYMDTYTITELPCAANKGYKLAEPVTKQVGDDSDTVSFDFGTIVNNEITLKTTTNDGLADKKMIYPEDKEITLVDKVSYTNLYTGREYTLKGKLMCKETGEVVKRSDGTEVTGETKFIPETESGTVNVEFTYNPYDCRLVGMTTVVFEDLYDNDEPVVSHADISDEAQTNYYPEISTTLTGENGSKMVLFSDNVTLIDKVSYKNIIAGETYIIEGVLINKNTRKPIIVNGEEVRNTVTFTADTSFGTIDVSYNFNAESAGLVKTDKNDNVSYSDVVCYEYLYYAGAGDKSLKAVHKDINDSDQTVTFPSGHTTALTADGSHEAAPVKQLTITDTVYYRGLIEGLEYTVTGKIMDKETGKPLVVNGEEITNTVTFTAGTSSGTVDVSFTFDASSLEGKSIVVFEDMKYQNKTIFVHNDINDEAQTINFPDKPNNPKTPKTGDAVNIFIPVFIILISLVGALILRKSKKKIK